MQYTLRITSWCERGGGSQTCEHYYGRIQPGHIDLEHEIELRDPLYQDSSLRCMLAKPGETTMTIRFATREEVIKAAGAWMKENAKEGDALRVL